jgi:hypothetical protein
VDVKVEKLVHCGEADIQHSPTVLPATLNDDASINKPEDKSGTSTATALESEMHVGVHSPALTDGTADPPCRQIPTTSAVRMQHLSASTIHHCM